MIKKLYGGQVVGGWLFDIRPVRFVRVRFRIRESNVLGPGPTFPLDLPWYHGNLILQLCLIINVFWMEYKIEWNIKAT